MRAVYMYVDAVFVFGIDISAYVRAFVYHKALFTRLLCLVREYAAEQPRAGDKIVVFFHKISAPTIFKKFYVRRANLSCPRIVNIISLKNACCQYQF